MAQEVARDASPAPPLHALVGQDAVRPQGEVEARMLFGKSLFQSVVDRLDKEAEEEVATEDAAFRINGLASSFVPLTPPAPAGPTDPGTDQRLDAYLFLMPEEREPEPPAPPPPPVWIDRMSLDDVAADLGLDPGDDRERLQERRRAFARDNHPDRIAEAFREAATMRMKMANSLIDDAIRRSDGREIRQNQS